MYINYEGAIYTCKCSIGSNDIKYIGLPEDFPAPANGEILLCADDGFVLRADSTVDYIRQTFADGILTLTNEPEPEVVEPEEEPGNGEPTTAEILDALLGVK